MGNVLGKDDKQPCEQTRFAKKTSASVEKQILTGVKAERITENDTE